MNFLTRLCLLLLLPVISASGQTTGFTADFTEGCKPLIVHFTNNAIGATGYSWDLGNGVTSYHPFPTITAELQLIYLHINTHKKMI